MLMKAPQLISVKLALQELKTVHQSTQSALQEQREEVTFYKAKSERLVNRMREMKRVIEERIVEDSEGLHPLMSQEDKGEENVQIKGLAYSLNKSIKLTREQQDQREEITELCGSNYSKSIFHRTSFSQDLPSLSVKSLHSLGEPILKDFANLTSLTTQKFGHRSAKFFVDLHARQDEQLFSCKVYYFKDFQICQKRILLIEGTRIYFFNPNSYQLIVSHSLADIEQLLLITHSAELIMLRVKNYHPYLLQTLHRIELASYITEQRKILQIPLQPHVVEGLLLTKGGSVVDGLLPTGMVKKAKKVQISGLLSKIVKSITLSPAELKDHLLVCIQRGKKSIQIWTQKIVALTKVGLLVFQNFLDQQPFFIPLMNAKLSQFSRSDLQNFPTSFIARHNDMIVLLIEIEQLSSIQIAFPSAREMSQWTHAIEKHQFNYNKEERNILQNSKLF